MAKKVDELILRIAKGKDGYTFVVQHRHLGKDTTGKIKFPVTRGRLINAIRQAVTDWEGES